jgi:hypothetical protein
VQKLWPVFAIAAAALIAWMLLAGGEDADEFAGGDDIVGYDAKGNPILLTAEGQPAPATPPPEDPAARAARLAREAAEKAAAAKALFLEGIVLQAGTRTPIPGARLATEPAGEPCPRLPTRRVRRIPNGMHIVGAGLGPPGPEAITTDAQGRFRWEADAALLRARWDVFVSAPRHVGAALCAPAAGSNLTVELQKALQQRVQVTDLHGRPIEAAEARIVPAEGTPAVPGHASWGTTDADGRAELDGLLPGNVMLRAEHAEYMPGEIGPFDPAAGNELTIRLAPALRVTFEIRSDDASEIQNPTVAWRTNGKPPHTDLVLLATQPKGPESAPLSEVHSAPIRIPCDHREVRMEIKADGFEAVVPAPEPLPVSGGERTIQVNLRRDASLASLEVRFEDGDGEPVSFAGEGGIPLITRLDETPMGSGIVLEAAETLKFPALPAGPYRVGMRCAKYAPAEVEVTVRAGEPNQATVRLGPPAKVHLRFVASEPTLVQFQVLHQGRPIPAFREGAPPRDDGGDGTSLSVEGGEGAVLSGLPAGEIEIRITSETLVASSHTLHLRAGETAEAEIEVRFR